MKHIGRKFYHTIGGVALLSLYFLLGREKALAVYGVLFLFICAVEVVRLTIPAVNRFFFASFGDFIRESEHNKPTGTLWYLLGIALAFALYTPAVAATAICFLAFGDVAATAVGEQYGKRKIAGKSLEGTMAFLFAALCAGFLLVPLGVGLAPGVIVIGALVSAGVELLPFPVNDNLTIPVVSGGCMELLIRLLG